MRPQRRRIGRLLARRHHIGHQPLGSGSILARDHRRLRDTGMPHQRGLDLARLDPEAAQLHLRVRTTQELQHPVRAPARQVAGPVHPAPRRPMRVGNEPLAGQPRPPQIAARQPRSRNVKLPRHPRRNRLQAGIQNISLRVRNRSPDRNGIIEAGPTIRRKTDAECGAFGWAVAVDQMTAALRLDHLTHVRSGKNIAARQKLRHARNGRKVLIDDLLEKCGRQPQHADPLVRDDALECGEVETVIRVDDQPGAVEQRTPDLEGRGVERQRRQLQKSVSSGQLDIVRAPYEPHNIIMSDHHAFRRAGGARGVDDVGGVVRVERAARARCSGCARDGRRIGIEPHDVGTMRAAAGRRAPTG